MISNYTNRPVSGSFNGYLTVQIWLGCLQFPRSLISLRALRLITQLALHDAQVVYAFVIWVTDPEFKEQTELAGARLNRVFINKVITEDLQFSERAMKGRFHCLVRFFGQPRLITPRRSQPPVWHSINYQFNLVCFVGHIRLYLIWLGSYSPCPRRGLGLFRARVNTPTGTRIRHTR